MSYDCEVEGLDLVFPPAELALEIRNHQNVSYSEISLGETFTPEFDESPISARCFLRNPVSKDSFGVESDLISTNIYCKKYIIISSNLILDLKT